VLLNAIPDLGPAKSDFLDRSIIVELPPIDPNNRRDEETSGSNSRWPDRVSLGASLTR